MKPLYATALAAFLLLTAAAHAAPVDINRADAAELDRAMVGVGAARAQAIVDHREQHGPFKSVDELTNVKGIGAATVERNRSNLRVGDE
jgi:competence protein ComEA